MRVFLFLPDGEDPDDYVRKRGKAAFEAAVERAMPLSEFLLANLSARHPPTTAEGRAALVAAARPYLALLTAPMLSALLRRRLSDLTGLPDSDLRGLLPPPESRPARPRASGQLDDDRGFQRHPVPGQRHRAARRRWFAN